MYKKLDRFTQHITFIVIICLWFLVISACTLADDKEAEADEKMISALIIGSAEHPDPVLEMVRELEEKGILKNVIVRESFPVQIEVTGPADVIETLNAIPKKVSPSFK